MAYVVEMPKMGVVMKEGTISEWIKAEGEPVAKGDVLFRFETDKTEMDYTARNEEGVMLKVMAEEDGTYECGTPLCIIGEEGEDVSDLVSLPASEE